MSSWSLRHLPDDVVSHELAAATAADACSTAAHLARIAEFDRRRLFLDAACSSMYRYCVDRLHMSEDVAVQRIRAARFARDFPAIFDAIAAGRLNLSTVVLVGPRLTRENAAELLHAVEHRTSKTVRRLLAERFGRPAQPEHVSLAPAASPDPTETLSVAPEAEDLYVLKRIPAPSPGAELANGAAPPPLSDAGPAQEMPARRARIEPIGPGQFELVAVLGQEAYDQLEASRDLLGHAVPSGALIEVLERAIALQHEHLRKRRCGATDRPRTSAADAATRPSTNPRQVPAAVERAVWERDGGQCAYVSPDGHRCEERREIELDHIVPVAKGGQSTVENLRLLCQPHNRHVANREFGKEHMQAKREEAKRRRAAERFHKQAERERTEKRKAEISRQREELGVAFQNLGWHGAKLERALACCATRPEASLEERLRYAVGFMAPNARKELREAI